MLQEQENKFLIIDQTLKNAHGHHLEYSISVAEAAAKRNCKVIVGVHKDFDEEVAPKGMDFVPVFSGMWDLNPAFVEELAALMRKVDLRSCDHVFIHTIGMKDAIPLLENLTSRISGELLSGPVHHILFRRDPREYSQELTQKLAQLLREFSESPALSEAVKFYTDTEELTVLHEALSPARFTTVPIPIRHELVVRRQKARAGKAKEPLIVGYLGDARPEKGFQYLPDLVASLWFSHVETRQIKFRFQSNFNLPGGEPGMVGAVNRLHQFPSSKVELIEGPFEPSYYYELLADTDIVLVLQDPQRYEARSSGILNEAMLAGKPVIVPAGSWMSNQVSERHARIFEAPSELADAVASAVTSYDELSRGALEAAARWAETHSPLKLVDILLAAQRPAQAEDGRHIVFIFNADYVCDNSGAAQVFLAQLRYMQTAGYAVHGFGFSFGVRIGEDFVLWSKQVRKRLRDKGLSTLSLSGTSASSGQIETDEWLYEQHRKGLYSFRRDVATARQVGIPSSLLKVFRQHKIETVFLNYICNYPMIENLSTEHIPTIVELCDIQAFQEAIARNTLIDERELDFEVGMIDKCDVAIFIQPIEEEKLKGRLTHAKCITASPPANKNLPTISDLAGPRDLYELVAGSGTDRLEISASFRQYNPGNTEVQNLVNMKSIDLLFVSSNHVPNVRSYLWFYDKIFNKHLATRGVTLCVAGSICYSDPNGKSLSGWGEPNVLMAGRIGDLGPLYAAAKIIVTPVSEGAGYSIKTIEALSIGKPLVTTSAGMRGLRYDPARFQVFNDPTEFAERIVTLLQSPTARLHAATEGRRVAHENASFERYAGRLDVAFRWALGDRALPVGGHAQGFDPIEPIEWRPEIGLVNALIRSWMQGRPFDRKIYARWHGLRAKPSRDEIRELYAALVERRDATFLSRGAALMDPVAGDSAHYPCWEAFMLALDGRAGEEGSRVWSIYAQDDASVNSPNSTRKGGLLADRHRRGWPVLWQAPPKSEGWFHRFDFADAGDMPALTGGWLEATRAGGRPLLAFRDASVALPAFRDQPLEIFIEIAADGLVLDPADLPLDIWIDDVRCVPSLVERSGTITILKFDLPALPAAISSGCVEVGFFSKLDSLQLVAITGHQTPQADRKGRATAVSYLDWMLHLPPERFIYECYARVLCRKADEDGAASYLTELTKGLHPRAAMLAMLDSPEYREKESVSWLEDPEVMRLLRVSEVVNPLKQVEGPGFRTGSI